MEVEGSIFTKEDRFDRISGVKIRAHIFFGFEEKSQREFEGLTTTSEFSSYSTSFTDHKTKNNYANYDDEVIESKTENPDC